MADVMSNGRPMSKLEQHLRSPEVLAACDEIDARAKDSACVPPPVDWRPDPFGPDPFGGDWDWLTPADDGQPAE